MTRAPHSALSPFASDAPQAKKRFGQNFLHDGQVIARIVRAIRPQAGDLLVEIGPGLGALTAPLLQAVPDLHAVEIDRELAPRLRQQFADYPQFVVHEADALNFDFAALAQPGRRLRIVGNLPYNISTPLLFHLLSYGTVVSDMHFMLQKEVVDRIVAGPGEDAYGRLSVTVAARAQADDLFTVGPGAFRPAPKVDSAIVRLQPRPAPFAIDDLATFDRVVTAAFAQRRKQLANALGGLLDAETIQACGVDPRIRAERVSPAEYATLANTLARQAGAAQA